MSWQISYFILLMLFRSSYQISTIFSENYIGAVVHYHPIKSYVEAYTPSDSDGVTSRYKNAVNYKEIIEVAAKHDVDIIVFPEFGLTSFPVSGLIDKEFKAELIRQNSSSKAPNIVKIRNSYGGQETYSELSDIAKQFRNYFKTSATVIPYPDGTVIPCLSNTTEYEESLRMVSCAARDNNMYVVVNHYEKAKCPLDSCPYDDYLLFNTNVVFDRKGQVVARYRKYSMHYEPWADEIPSPEESIFTTDFGVTFGQLIGLDMLTHDKLGTYAPHKTRVTDVVYSTHLHDEVPFFNLAQDQATWAQNTDINLLASGFSLDGGSGIYIGKHGELEKFELDPASNYLIFGKIPKRHRLQSCVNCVDYFQVTKVKLTDLVMQSPITIPGRFGPAEFREKPSSMADYIDFDLAQTRELDLSQKFHKESVCLQNICCHFDIYMDTPANVNLKYRILALQNYYKFPNGVVFSVEACALIACTGDKIEDCDNKFLNPIFKKDEPSADFLSINVTRIRAGTHVDTFCGPLARTGYGMLIPRTEFDYDDVTPVNPRVTVIKLTESTTELQVFGINGRTINTVRPDNIQPDEFFEDLVWKIFSVLVALLLILVGGLFCSWWRKKKLKPSSNRQEDIPLQDFSNPQPNADDNEVKEPMM